MGVARKEAKVARRCFLGLVAAALLFFLSGCATCKNKDLEMQGLRDQIRVLETELQVKDNEIANLRESFAQELQEKENMAVEVTETKDRPSVKQIQAALKNAGHNPGPIDGRMGKQTRDAIRAFQRANGLAVDGRVGKLTWALLKEYLVKKVK